MTRSDKIRKIRKSKESGTEEIRGKVGKLRREGRKIERRKGVRRQNERKEERIG